MFTNRKKNPSWNPSWNWGNKKTREKEIIKRKKAPECINRNKKEKQKYKTANLHILPELLVQRWETNKIHTFKPLARWVKHFSVHKQRDWGHSRLINSKCHKDKILIAVLLMITNSKAWHSSRTQFAQASAHTSMIHHKEDILVTHGWARTIKQGKKLCYLAFFPIFASSWIRSKL